MKAKRFVAKDMRRALEMVRQNLGEDAVILSTRRVREGVEILASSETAAQGDASPQVASSTPAYSDSLFPDQAHKAGKNSQQILADIELASRRLAARQSVDESADEFLGERQVVNAGIRVPAPRLDAAPTVAPEQYLDNTVKFQSAAERYGLLSDDAFDEPTADTAVEHSGSQEIAHLQEEILQMRQLLEDKLAIFAPMPPGRAASGSSSGSIVQRLQSMGFSERVTQALMKRPLKNRLVAKAWPEAMARLAKAIPVCGEDVTAKGGIFAFVGPTGAGKTTTVAKLAARYVMRHGADKVALVTTDTHRLAAHDQLRSLASILNVPLRVVDEHNALPQVLRSLRNVELVLIDTAGLRHGDPALKQQMQALSQIPRVQSFVVLPANSQAQMLKASLHAYSGAELKGCILSKLDETASIGEAVDCAIQAKLPIAYTTDGQDIPDDITVAKGPNILSRAASLVSSVRQKHRVTR
ncbi:flagellar biosynthesis protein FlhF [Gilvimarinus sp. SDUM040013]|uniref:Flagellar biosynthesis protein FlhF n=1 Tax=Gilvimarinus gilvus TaxID=3058038 RepID=A0ABU4RUT3_9GAMM|nr:flagellar biosynthesis protein FlhF [Gilvimarinus sp. SDUM040013]MDO3385044.1 flagellar biosynthesis protein FlhF [Gilvimarinus sp. SDUM040013]MDX6848419.1 flagellar biosynthesis protein FlhF [Gilvimarinus sp. SDUM040013]